MSIFGDLETPAARKPERQLTELRIKPHKLIPDDHRGYTIFGEKELPIVIGVFNHANDTVLLNVEAKAAFDDGTAPEEILVSFFLNRKRIGDVCTDEFGIALLNERVPGGLFNFEHQLDELIIRVKGFAREDSAKVSIVDERGFWVPPHTRPPKAS